MNITQTFKESFWENSGKFRNKTKPVCNFDVSFHSQVNVNIEKDKEHPSIKIIDDDVLLESRFSFNEIIEIDILQGF